VPPRLSTQATIFNVSTSECDLSRRSIGRHVTAVAFGWIALDQVPSALELAGIALVLAGVALQEREELPAPAAADAP
jgi:drug/metabolite transporter (DMT)-like permease